LEIGGTAGGASFGSRKEKYRGVCLCWPLLHNLRTTMPSYFFQPFHMEQVDSEDHLNNISTRVRAKSKTPGLLQQLDHHTLGKEAGVSFE
jgi:hypothetical protein